MADEFDTFDEDFEMAYPIDGENTTEIPGIIDGEKETNPIKIIIKKFIENKNLRIGVIAGALAIIILIVVLSIAGANRPVSEEALVTPYYYSLPEYRFYLDEDINGYIPFVLLQVSLVFDVKYKDYSDTIDEASYQIQNEITKEYIQNVGYYNIKNIEKRQEVYDRLMNYMNKILPKPIIKEILEDRFEMSMMKRRY